MVKALVLAAGLGSRLRSVAGDTPKPLMPIGGRPVLAHTLDWLARAGVREAWINLHFGADAVRAAIGDGSALGLAVRYVYEPALLGTAGALANLGAVFDATMLVVYGDSFVRLDVDGLLARRAASGAEATVALYDRDIHPHTGIAGGRVSLDGQGVITGFVEGGDPDRTGLVNAGVYAVAPSILDLIPAGGAVDFGRDVFPAMLTQQRKLTGYLIDPDGFCLGLDTPESRAAGERLIAEGRVAP